MAPSSLHKQLKGQHFLRFPLNLSVLPLTFRSLDHYYYVDGLLVRKVEAPKMVYRQRGIQFFALLCYEHDVRLSVCNVGAWIVITVRQKVEILHMKV